MNDVLLLNYYLHETKEISLVECCYVYCLLAGSTEPKPASLCTFPSASSVSVSSNSLPPSPLPSKSFTRISAQGRRCSLPAASPKILQSPVFDESTPSLPLISQKSFGRKKERGTWTRKLSSVTDEKEEIEPSSLDCRRLEEINQEQFMLRAFLQQVERKNNEFCEPVDNELDELPDENSADDNCQKIQSRILHCFQNSAVGNFLSTPVIQELWQQNSTCTLARYFCSTVLAFIALCFLLSLILPGNCRKEDLCIVALELVETLSEKVTIVELTEIIKENKYFKEDVEFVKELIQYTIEDRKKAEEDRKKAEEARLR
ncbi:uncharacterized protein TNCT_728251 [Trichonephila clavata]|uniref:Uncharacterized protein n=1 Tax=Trichonephila clavata TaxID=2740835 RepID=A0A8X6LDF8_TRICU|nr:uncharacterized protein TNCT_728251 [Trichonephila clavata]